MSFPAMSFPALGTTACLVVDGEEPALAAAHIALQRELDAVDRTCSRFRPDSELVRLNSDTRPCVPASPLLLEAVAVALRGAQVTGGLVDPTLGRAIRILGYDREWVEVPPDGPETFSVEAESQIPGWQAGGGNVGDSQVPGAVGSQVDGSQVPSWLVPGWLVPGWRAVTLNVEEGTISRPPGLELDLGATAKALAADRAASAAAYRLPGVGLLVSLGGDAAVAGPAPEGGWSVRVSDDHAAPPGAPGQTVIIASGGLATSGTTVRRWRRGGTELHHILDPATSRPAGVVWHTVSVTAGTCVDANIASTAAIVLGHGAPAWLEARGLPARLVGPAGRVCRVSGWPQP